VIAQKFFFISLGTQTDLADYINSNFARAAGLHVNGPEVNIDDQFPGAGGNAEVLVKLFVSLGKDNKATTQEDNKRCFHSGRSITRSNARRLQARVIAQKTSITRRDAKMDENDIMLPKLKVLKPGFGLSFASDLMRDVIGYC
jgi:hypothetical protein